jgi:hypothetical protein
VRVRFERVPGDSTPAASLRNTSSEPLHLTVTAANSQTGHQSTVEIDVAPMTTVELGASGLQLEHGDEVTISSPSYEDRSLRGI